VDTTLDQPNDEPNNQGKPDTNTHPDEKPSVSFWQILVSVMQASFGVQTQSNHERDFKQGKLLPFIVAAVLFTALFVFTVAFVVSLVLPK
jgi:hypothetical protein